VNPGDIAPDLGDAEVVYLSPHLDDAVLSCGGAIARARAQGRPVAIWTLFTADEPVAAPSPFAAELRRWWHLPAGEVMAARRAEDEEACRRLGARARHAGWTEAPYRLDAAGRPLYASLAALFGAFDPADRPLVERLAEQFRNHLSGRRVLAPLAVGGHVDHRVVRAAAEASGVADAYYEDFPYVEWKWGALRRALGKRSDWLPEVEPLEAGDVAARVEAIAAYRSQVPSLFRTEARLAKQVRRAVRRAGGERLWRPRSPVPATAR